MIDTKQLRGNEADLAVNLANDCANKVYEYTVKHIYRPHKSVKGATCTAWDLVLVSEGVQCSRCNVLVTEHITFPSKESV